MIGFSTSMKLFAFINLKEPMFKSSHLSTLTNDKPPYNLTDVITLSCTCSVLDHTLLIRHFVSYIVLLFFVEEQMICGLAHNINYCAII